MNLEQRARVEQLFHALIDLPAAQQDAELARRCADDQVVRKEVTELLAAASQSRNRMNTSVTAKLQEGAGRLDELSDKLPKGMRIGDFEIADLLGQGGLGQVYKALEHSDVKRPVAIKVILPGMDTHEVLARFKNEGQVLANLNHPNIAKLLHAGSTKKHRPLFVMEYVPGEPITKFADSNRLSIADRLRLFQQVCDAINHAHQKSIVHRDIKSSNILVYMLDGKPMAKVIDFGIAKILSGDRLTEYSEVNTSLDSRIGSKESMSPEQAAGKADIDTLTDVYSLGVVLYELLAGCKPFDLAHLKSVGDDEARRIIREEDPPRPSSQLSSAGAAGDAIARARQMPVDKLIRHLRPELDFIPLMAMRKERQRRYANPLALSEDIDNFLNKRPLKARPESAGYRAAKFIRRNAAALTLLLGTGLALLVATILSSDWAYRERIAKQHAQTAESEVKVLLAESETERLKVLTFNHFLAQRVRTLNQMERHLPTLNFDGIVLGDVLEFLQQILGDGISIDRKALVAADIIDAPVTAKFSRPTLEVALQVIEQQPSLNGKLRCVVNDQGVVIVTTRSLADKIVVTSGYDISHVADNRPEVQSLTQDIRVILGTEGGTVEQHEGTLWVRTSTVNQAKIQELLSLLPPDQLPKPVH